MKRHNTTIPTHTKMIIAVWIVRPTILSEDPMVDRMTPVGLDEGCTEGRFVGGLREGAEVGCPLGWPVGIDDGKLLGTGLRSVK